MKITLYGTRGSLAAPMRNQDYQEKMYEILKLYSEKNIQGPEEIPAFFESLPEYLKYTAGGDTTCINVVSDLGKEYMLDCGTGGRNLGNDLLKRGFLGKGVLEVFVTHTHWDHIQGFPFFKPIYIPGNVLNFHSPFEDLEDRLIRQQIQEFFPIGFHATASKKNFHTMQRGEEVSFEDGMKISYHPLKHPGGSFAYKFVENGKTFIFATDAEFTGTDMETIIGMSEFFGNADILVLDTQYTLDESFKKFDWGHTCYTMAVNSATIWNIKKLVLTHHEPDYSDQKVFGILEESKEHKFHLGGPPLEIVLAREGMQINL